MKNLKWSPNGGYIAILGENGRLELRNTDGTIIHTFGDCYITTMEWYPDINEHDGTLLMAWLVLLNLLNSYIVHDNS